MSSLEKLSSTELGKKRGQFKLEHCALYICVCFLRSHWNRAWKFQEDLINFSNSNLQMLPCLETNVCRTPCKFKLFCLFSQYKNLKTVNLNLEGKTECLPLIYVCCSSFQNSTSQNRWQIEASLISQSSTYRSLESWLLRSSTVILWTKSINFRKDSQSLVHVYLRACLNYAESHHCIS